MTDLTMRNKGEFTVITARSKRGQSFLDEHVFSEEVTSYRATIDRNYSRYYRGLAKTAGLKVV